MDSQEIASRVVGALARCGVPHMVVGSFARNFHSFARSTQDADIVLAVDAAGLSRFEAELGPEFSFDPQATFETNTGTFRHTLKHVATEFKIELFLLSNEPFDQQRFSRRQAFRFNDYQSFVLTAEDLILSKLRWSRAKDFEDIADVMAVKGVAALDWNYLNHWADQHGTRAKLDELRASVPTIE